MPSSYDLTDLKMLDLMGKHSPRNLSEIARMMGLTEDAVRKRIERLDSHFFLRFTTNIYCTNLGLKKAVVLATAPPGYEEVLFDCLKANDFWIYVARCYGMNEGCVAYYTIPKDYSLDFERFIAELQRTWIARNVWLHWSTCFQGANSKAEWFDEKSKSWVFSWGGWLKEIPTKDYDLPRTLIDPLDYPIAGDKIDVLILKELEKNPRADLKEIGQALELSRSRVGYHYREHILKRNLLEEFGVFIQDLDSRTLSRYVFILKFDSYDKCARFAASLLSKPFVDGVGKILKENSLISNICLPTKEFRSLVEILSKMVRAGLLVDYSYVILDLNKTQRQTISYEYFDDGVWNYDHDKHVRNLLSLVPPGLGSI